MRATDHGTLHSLRYFSAFLRHENAIPELSCDPRLKVMWLPLDHIGHFDTLKMPFCRVVIPKHMGTWFLVKTFIAFWRPENVITQVALHLDVGSFRSVVTWKWDSSRFIKLLVGEYMAFVEHLFVILAAWKSDFYRGVKSSNRGTLLHVNNCSTFWQHKKVQDSLGSKILCNCESSSVLKPSAQCYVTTGRPFLDISKSSKCHSVVPWAQGYITSS